LKSLEGFSKNTKNSISGFHRAFLKSITFIGQFVAPGTHTAGPKLRCQTPTTHTKNITSNFSLARSTLPEVGSLTIRNTPE